MLNQTLLFLLIATLLALPLSAQEADSLEHHHKHNEIALGTGAVYMPNEKTWGYGLHLHSLAGITDWMGLGAGYELILGEHTHQTVMGLVHFHPFHPLDINLGPGLVFPDEENENYRFKMHVEVAAVFEVSEHLHLGPGIDIAFGKGDLHFAFGIHVGWVFDFH
jgi:hypothetical protein